MSNSVEFQQIWFIIDQICPLGGSIFPISTLVGALGRAGVAAIDSGGGYEGLLVHKVTSEPDNRKKKLSIGAAFKKHRASSVLTGRSRGSVG